MADALCGPSNALQNFKQHAQSDRSLHQDRFTGPRTPVQGFRSQDPRAGSLDADFHKFENASATPFLQPLMNDPFAVQQQQQYHHNHHHQAPTNPDWAADFQQLRLSSQPLPVEQFRTHAPLVKSSALGGWQHEFTRQQNSPASALKGKQVAFDQQQTMSSYAPPNLYSPTSIPMSYQPQPTDLQNASLHTQVQIDEQVNDADWSQAFEEAFQDAFEDVEQTEQVGEINKTQTPLEKTAEQTNLTANAQPLEQIRIGSDAIQYTEKQDQTAEHDAQDANALARVAGELLHNVQHDNSPKFQNSQFLNLMRKIRDRQVEVRNNEFGITGANLMESTAGSLESANAGSNQDIRTVPDPDQGQSEFAFPNLNAVYAPQKGDYVDFSFDPNQSSYVRNQISDLHPGGRLYPEQSPPSIGAQMSGAVSATSISAADFEAGYDENRNFATRFQRPAAA